MYDFDFGSLDFGMLDFGILEFGLDFGNLYFLEFLEFGFWKFRFGILWIWDFDFGFVGLGLGIFGFLNFQFFSEIFTFK